MAKWHATPGASELKIVMPAIKPAKIIVVLLVGFLLSVSHVALAQVDEAAALNQQIVQLYSQGRYSEAIPFAQRALTIREKERGPDDLRQNNLASLYKAQGRYADSEPPFKRALAIREKDLVPIIRMSQWD